MAAEDFGALSLGDKIPLCMFWLGTVDSTRAAQSKRDSALLPSLHSSQFAPTPETTILTGMKATAAVVLDLMKNDLQ